MESALDVAYDLIFCLGMYVLVATLVSYVTRFEY